MPLMSTLRDICCRCFEHHRLNSQITVKMEPLSIALGVSGLIPLFKVCTQLFDLVDSNRTQGTDFEILSTMLEIERVRLCIWGQAVGFVTDDQSALDTNFPTELDDRLEDRRISAAVSDVRACMKRIFEGRLACAQTTIWTSKSRRCDKFPRKPARKRQDCITHNIQAHA